MNPYGVLHYESLTDLLIEANKMVALGYAPAGGIAIESYVYTAADGDTQTSHYYVQAMYKKPAAKKREANGAEYSPAFETVWSEYPKRAGSNPKRKAYKAYNARCQEAPLNEGIEIHAGTIRYRKFIQETGKSNTEFVMQAATFFGPDQHYLNDWALPEPEKEGATMLPAKNTELEPWAVANDLPIAPPGMDYAEYRQFLLARM